MDEQRLSEIKARADAATPGPLTVDGHDAKPYRACTWRVVRDDGITIAANCTKADAELFAASRQDVPDLLEYIDELRRQLEKAKKERDFFEGKLISCEAINARFKAILDPEK